LRKEVIIREFGSVTVDDELIAEDAAANILLVTGGCLFTDPQTTLYWTLENLYSRCDKTGGNDFSWQDVDFDYLLLETSGLDVPEFLAGLFFLDHLRDHYRLDSYIVVVDAEYGELNLDEYRRAREQVAFADILLLNKIDLADEATIDRLERRLGRINVLARTYRTEYTRINLDKILNVRLYDAAPNIDGLSTAPIKEETVDDFQSVVLSETRPLDKEKVNAWIHGLFTARGNKILRSKGFLNFAGYDHRFVFQGVRRTFHSKADRRWRPDEERNSTIVLIGEGLEDAKELQRSFSECVA
jgi:G3E family GTPase